MYRALLQMEWPKMNGRLKAQAQKTPEKKRWSGFQN